MPIAADFGHDGPGGVMLRIGCLAAALLFSFAVRSDAETVPQDGRFLTTTGAARAPVGFAQACADFSWLCGRVGRSSAMADAQLRGLAESINAYVNRSVSPRDASSVRWTLPSSQGADCVSYSLMKLQMLLQQGVPSRHLFLATVLTERNESHAVLILRTSEGDFVLDNLRGSILPWSQTGYTFLKAQNASSRSRWDLVLLGPRARRA